MHELPLAEPLDTVFIGSFTAEDLNAAHLYRFLRTRDFAKSLVNGDVYISTLETCRNHENGAARDAREAMQQFLSGHVAGNMSDPVVKRAAQTLGLGLPDNAQRVEIAHCVNTTRLPDAYVLCLTLRANREKMSGFGSACVRISRPYDFFYNVTRALWDVSPLTQALVGPVAYRPDTYTGLQPPPGPLGFVKDRDQYATEQEFRFLWVPQDMRNLEPFTLPCPEVRGLCEILDP